MAGRTIPQRIAERLLTEARTYDRADGLPPAALLPAHAHVVLISDFLVPLPELASMIDHFADQDVHGHLLQVLDPAEVDLPYTGQVRASRA